MADIIMESKGLTKVYKQGDRSIYAVNDCNIKIYRGSFTAVVGSSGSGKSTLLNLLSMMDLPTTGKVYIDGKDIYSLRGRELARFRNRDIGFIFQQFHLLPILTAKENILMPALISGTAASEMYFNDLCKFLHISDRLDHLPSELSGGQQQRVAIARAMINRPKIIFADEPTGNLDKESASEFISMLISSGKKYNQTILMVTHAPEIADMADAVYKIDDGIIHRVMS